MTDEQNDIVEDAMQQIANRRGRTITYNADSYDRGLVDGYKLAADEIERLRARVAHLEYWVGDAHASADALRVDLMGALEHELISEDIEDRYIFGSQDRAEMRGYVDQLRGQAAEIERLRAENNELRASWRRDDR